MNLYDLHIREHLGAGARSSPITINLIALLLGWVALPPDAAAQGFRNPPAGTLNVARAGISVAQVDDASAITQNPANLVDLPDAEAQIAINRTYLSVKFVPPFRARGRSTDPWQLEPNAFFAMPLGDGHFAAGLGITTPYGVNSRWDTSASTFNRYGGPWRYGVPFSTELTTLNLSPSLAAKLGEHFSIGAGLDVTWSELKLKEFYPWSVVTRTPGPDGEVRESADGLGVGGNVALTAKITERQRIALTFRSPIDLTLEGDFRLDNVPVNLGGGAMRRDFRTRITLPATLAGGYGINLTDKLRLEADVEWLQFSHFNDLPLRVADPPPGLPGGFTQNWKDTINFGLGGDLQFAPGWVLRAGYQFCQSPVPSSTFTPLFPDADRNIFSIGLGFKYGHHTIEAAGSAEVYDTRFIRQGETSDFNGTYTFTAYLFSAAYQFTF